MASSLTMDRAVPQATLALRLPKLRVDRRTSDRIFRGLLTLGGVTLLLLLAAIAGMLLQGALPAFSKFGLGFFATSQWDPVQDNYGVLPLIFGTLASSILALLFATPLSIGVAIFLTEVLPSRVAKPLGFLVEMLAAIPSVVYGLWGMFVLAPLLREYVEPWLAKHLGFLPFFSGPAYGVGMLCAALVLSLMVLPTICSLSREVFLSIPRSYREAALGIGATRWETVRVGVLSAARSGLLGAVFLGFGRALGETMAVTMVIGNRSQIALSLFAPAQTMASSIANEYAEATGQLHLSALAAVGATLFLVTLATNTLAHGILHRILKEAKA